MAEFQDELELLLFMYPDEITFNTHDSELSYQFSNARLVLRIPQNYPLHEVPEVISAMNPSKQDLRDIVTKSIQGRQPGESCIDAIISDFQELLVHMQTEEREIKEQREATKKELDLNASEGRKTVIIWLHHLLATSKRKQALCPEGTDAASISGVTKPGYPGVLLFSGSAIAVNTHVQTLKNLRWQAFQVRYEADEKWTLKHGNGIIEVETMGQIVAELEQVDGGKAVFMEAMKMR
jgi:hypothetical protein